MVEKLKKSVMQKAKDDDGMTVKEILQYRKMVQPKVHTYGKYGNLAKIYLEEHNVAKFWALAGDLPKYLHGIDRQAGEMYDSIYMRLSQSQEFKKTGDYISDLRKETEVQKLIEQEILDEIIYVDKESEYEDI